MMLTKVEISIFKSKGLIHLQPLVGCCLSPIFDDSYLMLIFSKDHLHHVVNSLRVLNPMSLFCVHLSLEYHLIR